MAAGEPSEPYVLVGITWRSTAEFLADYPSGATDESVVHSEELASLREAITIRVLQTVSASRTRLAWRNFQFVPLFTLSLPTLLSALGNLIQDNSIFSEQP